MPSYSRAKVLLKKCRSWWTSVSSLCFFFSSRRRHTRCSRDWSSDVCSSDLESLTCSANYPRQKSWALHVNDSWKVTTKFTANFGVRWDYFSPSREKYNHLSFFDPAGMNPDGIPGSLAFADRKSTRLNSSHGYISYAVFC